MPNVNTNNSNSTSNNNNNSKNSSEILMETILGNFEFFF